MSVILTHTGTLILSLIALFLTVFSFVVQNKKIAALMQCVSFLCVLAVVVYALLLGAQLTEILVLVLVFVVLNLISFIPKKEIEIDEKQIATDNITEDKQDKPSGENKENGNEL